MEAQQLRLTVVTPRGHLLFTGTDPKTRTPGIDVDEVTATGILGEFGVLPGHLPFLTDLKAGPLTFRQGEHERWIAVRGGLAEVGPDKVIVLAEAAEAAEDIDYQRAQSAMQRAAKRLEEPGMLGDIDYEKALQKFKRAQMRIEVAGHARKK